ncbi:unnamed protein product [Phytomonas sp. EM1]|nr:unnamed protein product [Phytomonas sp. EM1]|eukprot:CCW62821.1 unnamed protein product [Phytomonas sp. isolate EM1]
MLWRCAARLKQTKRPPRRVLPFEANPLVRWSLDVPTWRSIPPHLSELVVGLEGCHSAFNATNAIRTCIFFGTAAPPSFLKLRGWQDIEHMQFRATRNSDYKAFVPTVDEANRDLGLALFGEGSFLRGNFTKLPMVALENFTPRSQSIFRIRFPYSCRLVVGHENLGIRSKFLFPSHKVVNTFHKDMVKKESDGDTPNVLTKKFDSDWSGEDTCAKTVVYIPQYGTISSLNVVTSLGIALFYAYLDRNFPQARTIVSNDDQRNFLSDGKTDLNSVNEANNLSALQLRRTLSTFHSVFEESLPIDADMCVSEKALLHSQGNPTPRVDVRPIHPNYYRRDSAAIKAMHRNYRAALLAYCEGENPRGVKDHRVIEGELGSAGDGSVGHFGLSVLYENDFDQRNFGGVIRNANAFLVDHVFYIGRRKFNVVGSVGSYHYTPPTFLGPMPEAEPVEDFAETLRRHVEAAYGAVAPPRFWFLDCGHGFLYTADFCGYKSSPRDVVDPGSSTERDILYGYDNHPEDDGMMRARTNIGETNQVCASDPSRSSLESLRWYFDRIFERRHVVSLCDREADILKSAGRNIDGDQHVGPPLGRPIVLVVPQEGKLPHIEVLQLCEHIVTLVPFNESGKASMHLDRTKDMTANSVSRGLPIQVASGIALQRLSAVLHPRIQRL